MSRKHEEKNSEAAIGIQFKAIEDEDEQTEEQPRSVQETVSERDLNEGRQG